MSWGVGGGEVDGRCKVVEGTEETGQTREKKEEKREKMRTWSSENAPSSPISSASMSFASWAVTAGQERVNKAEVGRNRRKKDGRYLGCRGASLYRWEAMLETAPVI
jgi:hypothetical protein